MGGTLKIYEGLERRIKKNDLDGLLARWEFGKKLLDERGAAGRLPNGRREELSALLDISATEIDNRMQFAEQYESKKEVEQALKYHGSWRAIAQWGLGQRRQRTVHAPQETPGNALGWLIQRFDRFLEPGRDEALRLEVVVNDRTYLDPFEIEQLGGVTVDLFHRVQAALHSLRQRRLITPTVEPVMSAEELHALFAHDGPTLLDFAPKS
jgi:hypothetical protein